MKKAYFFLFLGFAFLGAAIFWGGKLVTALPRRTVLAALEVNTIPQAQVFLDGKDLGQTPLTNSRPSPGEYTLRIVPPPTASFSAWEKKIKLNPHLLTFVNYLFGPTERESTGETLTLEKTVGEKSEVVVLSDPDGASLSLDNKEHGVTPKIVAVSGTGEHQISLSHPGYHSRTILVKTWQGHKVLANIKLAALPLEVPSASQSAGPKVKILETPTGWLRVRVEPSVNASETARLQPGTEYLLLEERSDWLKIEYQEGEVGWISQQYAEKVEAAL